MGFFAKKSEAQLEVEYRQLRADNLRREKRNKLKAAIGEERRKKYAGITGKLANFGNFGKPRKGKKMQDPFKFDFGF